MFPNLESDKLVSDKNTQIHDSNFNLDQIKCISRGSLTDNGYETIMIHFKNGNRIDIYTDEPVVFHEQ